MNYLTNIVLIMLAIVFLPEKISAQQEQTAGYYRFETECLGSEFDGSITVKAWGSGRNRRDAVAQARKNALWDVLFKGIRKGRGQCDQRPMITEVNAEQMYKQYFNSFFADRDGAYKEFVSSKDERLSDRLFRRRLGSNNAVNYSVTVRVLCAELRQKLIEDGIIQQ